MFSHERIIFVTGASRSGTTLLALTLGNHSSIHKLPETHYFGELWDLKRNAFTAEKRRSVVTALYHRMQNGMLAKTSPESQEQAAEFDHGLPGGLHPAGVYAAAAKLFSERAGKSVACEQTPRNIFYARQLLRYYPNAVVVHVVRDPRAVIASQKHRWRRRGRSVDPSLLSRSQQLRTLVNYHPFTAATLWNSATAAALELADEPRFFLLKFEDLISNPTEQARSLCNFLQLEFEPTMLDVEWVNSSHDPSRKRSTGFSTDSINRWQTLLSSTEVAIVNKICNNGINRFGYPPHPAHARWHQKFTYQALYPIHLAGVIALNPKRLATQVTATLGRMD